MALPETVAGWIALLSGPGVAVAIVAWLYTAGYQLLPESLRAALDATHAQEWVTPAAAGVVAALITALVRGLLLLPPPAVSVIDANLPLIMQWLAGALPAYAVGQVARRNRAAS